jgi:hypothetical protein
MRYTSLVFASLLLATAAYGKDPKAYMSGKIIKMDSVNCGSQEKDAKSKHNTQELLCQQYEVQGEKTIYTVRPIDEKHRVLLPVGEQAQFRMQKDKMMLVVEAMDSKEREYVVVSMAPRTDASSADAHPAQVNHLQ